MVEGRGRSEQVKHQVVIDAIRKFYEVDCANIHRGVHELSQRSTAAYEETGKLPAREEIKALERSFPAGEFPHLREAMPYAGGFSDHGFEFGIRALARGLIAEAKSGCA